MSRKERGLSQSLFLVETIPTDDELIKKYSVMGTTGNVYAITISEEPECTCPDFRIRSKICKHIYFILLKVMKAGNSVRRKYSKEALKKMFSNIPAITSSLIINTALRTLYRQTTGEVEEILKDKNGEVKRQPTSDNCPVCLDELEDGNKLDYCKYGCGKSIHEHCFTMWCKQNNKSCVFCRTEWEKPKSKSNSSSSKGYVNLIDIGGVAAEQYQVNVEESKEWTWDGSRSSRRNRRNRTRRHNYYEDFDNSEDEEEDEEEDYSNIQEDEEEEDEEEDSDEDNELEEKRGFKREIFISERIEINIPSKRNHDQNYNFSNNINTSNIAKIDVPKLWKKPDKTAKDTNNAKSRNKYYLAMLENNEKDVSDVNLSSESNGVSSQQNLSDEARSAYLIFFDEQQVILKDQKKYKDKAMLTHIRKLWAELDKDEKNTYELLATYEKENLEYKNNKDVKNEKNIKSNSNIKKNKAKPKKTKKGASKSPNRNAKKKKRGPHVKLIDSDEE